MVLVLDKQSKHKVDVAWVKTRATEFLAKLKLVDWDLAIIFVESPAMAEYNKAYRGKDGITDVLSFQFYSDFVYPEFVQSLQKGDAKDLGDIIFCPDKISADCQEFELEFNDRLERLLAHSIVHLLGHDHKTDEQIAKMKPIEEMLLERTVNEYCDQ